MREGLRKRVLTVRGESGTHRQTYWVADQLPKEQRTFRFDGGNRADAKNSGVSPRERCTIHYGMFFAKEANAGVSHAVDAIAKVHNVPKDLYKVPIRVTGSLDGANGMYTIWSPFSSGNKIEVCKYARGAAGTLAHEYGHFLDHHLLGNGQPSMRGLASVQWAYKEPGGKEIAPLMRALYKSEAARKLVERHEHNQRTGNGEERYSQYLLMPPEMVARAYAQYIGQKASPQIRRDVEEHRRGWERHGYAAQWSDADFAPIAREFDKIFQRRGLARRRSAA